ncbi:amidohydrolase, partial [Escherichia coli]|nr:amidohydrolase [Escherichia coli]
SANTALPKAVDYLILGGTLVTMDDARTIIRDGGIAVKDGKIVSVGTRTEVSRNFRPRVTVNAVGKVVIPGLINTHTHIPMT